MVKITKKMGIIEVAKANPKAVELLSEAGMHCLGCVAAHFETLEDGCKAHGMSDKEIDKLIGKLNKE